VPIAVIMWYEANTVLDCANLRIFGTNPNLDVNI
jgi:hypothetical protein